MMKRWVLHPFLLGIFPIVSLYSNNVFEAKPTDLIGPIAFVVAVTGILWGLLYAAIRDSLKAGMVASILSVLFFGVIRCVDFLNDMIILITSLWVVSYAKVTPTQVMMGGIVISLLACYFVLRKLKDPALINTVLNIFSFALVLLPISSILMARPPISSRDRPIWKPEPLARLEAPDPLPDIYYIILDTYARTDVMKALFDFDNQPFLDRLEKKGFYVAKQATANYCQTRLCLSCSLNGKYLDDMVKGMGSDQTDLTDLIGKNNIVASLRPLGYKFISFSSGFHETDYPDCDLHLSPSQLPFTGFQRLLITTTPFGSLLPVPTSLNRFESLRERVNYTLDNLSEIADDSATTITFAHILSPHPPFLFGQDGEDIRDRDIARYKDEGNQFNGIGNEKDVYYRGYRDQAIYITKRIEQAIDQILAKSKTPPIILLQSDHGSGLNLNMDSMELTDVPERMTILNAYYFPDKRYEKLYDTITPVNSFRVVMNTFFGAKLDLLPDKSYFSTWGDPYGFHDVTEQVAGKPYKKPPETSVTRPAIPAEPIAHSD